MKDFPLQKLAKICKTSSPVELAMLAIGYDTEMLLHDRDFSPELLTVFSAVSNSAGKLFSFHWNIYKKLIILMQRVNANLAELMIFSERLYMCHLLIGLNPMLKTEDESCDMTVQINSIVDSINKRIQSITNFRYIVEIIEDKYLCKHNYISGHPVWISVQEAVSDVSTKHNTIFVINRLKLSNTGYKYINMRCDPDTKWSDGEISKILETAQPEYGGFHLI